MKGSERFQAALLEAVKNHILPSLEKDKEEFGAAVRNQLFNLDGPRVINRAPTPEDRFVGKIFRGFLELQKSVEALEDIAFYAGRFPYRNTRVTPERYLQFCVEGYLSEVYLLRERLVAYLKVVQRQYTVQRASGSG